MEEPPSPLSKELPSSFAGNKYIPPFYFECQESDSPFRDFYEESRWQKFTRKLKEEPLIPIGCGVTCWALWGATKSIRRGDSLNAQKMFRMRLYGQFFTVVAMVAGSFYYNSDRILRKEYDAVVQERKAQEKRNAWIKELEARDLEEKEWRNKLAKVREKQKEEVEARQAKEEKVLRDGGPITRAVNEIKDRIQ
ncbi:MAG: hypothetical protein Q9181_004077 [Wetmoreana brouardii]